MAVLERRTFHTDFHPISSLAIFQSSKSWLRFEGDSLGKRQRVILLKIPRSLAIQYLPMREQIYSSIPLVISCLKAVYLK